jgi:phosphoribosylanthranilate isomerase
MIIKICGITNLEDALAAVEFGATALGINFWKGSKRYLELPAANKIIQEIPKTVLAVGVFVDAPASVMDRIAEEVGLDAVQLHGRLDRKPKTPLWQAFSADTPGLRENVESSPAEAFVIDTPAGQQRGGTGKAFDWSLAAGLPGRIVIAGGLGADNVGGAIRAVRPWGVDACSRLELRPGRKDLQKMEDFIQAVLTEKE